MRKALSCLEVLVDYYKSCSWSDLCWWINPGEGKSGFEFPPFVHHLSDGGFVVFKHFIDGFDGVSLSTFRTWVIFM